MGGGAWPFLVRGVICLLNCDNERDLNLLNSGRPEPRISNAGPLPNGFKTNGIRSSPTTPLPTTMSYNPPPHIPMTQVSGFNPIPIPGTPPNGFNVNNHSVPMNNGFGVMGMGVNGMAHGGLPPSSSAWNISSPVGSPNMLGGSFMSNGNISNSGVGVSLGSTPTLNRSWEEIGVAISANSSPAAIHMMEVRRRRTNSGLSNSNTVHNNHNNGMNIHNTSNHNGFLNINSPSANNGMNNRNGFMMNGNANGVYPVTNTAAVPLPVAGRGGYYAEERSNGRMMMKEEEISPEREVEEELDDNFALFTDDIDGPSTVNRLVFDPLDGLGIEFMPNQEVEGKEDIIISMGGLGGMEQGRARRPRVGSGRMKSRFGFAQDQDEEVVVNGH
eukprot:TRINITY_DN4872_c0_g1_i1.p1 TRINITY_DN4872_c0_g1~~TRINITY_DN4872_c0_g1_i1.p1  ORF type:complete len:386 (-),score=131.80 TRINITY_DN4872_c0_g1_i1:56-1213(-)